MKRYGQIVVNHTTSTAYVRGTYGRRADAKRGAARTMARQGGDACDVYVFEAERREEVLAAVATQVDVLLFADTF